MKKTKFTIFVINKDGEVVDLFQKRGRKAFVAAEEKLKEGFDVRIVASQQKQMREAHR